MVYSAMREDGMNIDEVSVIAATLNPGGLDVEQILRLSPDPQLKGMLLKDTRSAQSRGAFGSPNFRVGDQFWFGKGRLRDVGEAILRVASA